MRIGFMFGGIVGAATALYLTRQKRRSGMMSMAGSSMSKMAGAVTSANPLGKIADAMSAMNDSNRTVSGAKSEEDAKNRIKKLIDQDPYVKSQVHEILSQNRETASVSHATSH